VTLTAAIGILVGIGFWFAAIVGALATLIVLALFRYIEGRLPSEFYAHHMLRFARDHVIGQAEVQKLIHDHGFTIANLSSRLSESGQQFEYLMTIKSRDRKNAEALATYLRGRPEVIEFRITPTGD
jgi:putative Mg2+ transporter-C (MgtC) family protein